MFPKWEEIKLYLKPKFFLSSKLPLEKGNADCFVTLSPNKLAPKTCGGSHTTQLIQYKTIVYFEFLYKAYTLIILNFWIDRSGRAAPTV